MTVRDVLHPQQQGDALKHPAGVIRLARPLPALVFRVTNVRNLRAFLAIPRGVSALQLG
jgi:hypothetical protein